MLGDPSDPQPVDFVVRGACRGLAQPVHAQSETSVALVCTTKRLVADGGYSRMAMQARSIEARSGEVPSPVHLWGIVVSRSDEGSWASERRPGTRGPRRTRVRRTATYALGRAGLFRRAIDRVSRLVAPERVVAILSREH